MTIKLEISVPPSKMHGGKGQFLKKLQALVNRHQSLVEEARERYLSGWVKPENDDWRTGEILSVQKEIETVIASFQKKFDPDGSGKTASARISGSRIIVWVKGTPKGFRKEALHRAITQSPRGDMKKEKERLKRLLEKEFGF